MTYKGDLAASQNLGSNTQQDQQLDSFICDILDASPKDDLGSMEHPLFSLSSKPDTKIRRYERNGIFVEITPSVLGHATIFDKDILIYCISQLVEAMNRRKEVNKTVKITAFDLITKTNRELGGRGYFLLEQALKRLAGTVVSTNIKTGKKKARTGFHIIEKYKIIEGNLKNDKMTSIEITLSDWLFEAVQAKEVLTLHQEYFQLRKALERRLYELARKHCGKQPEFKISIQALYEKSGSQAERWEFRRMVQAITDKDNLPGYHILFVQDEDTILFKNREEKLILQSNPQQLLLAK